MKKCIDSEGNRSHGGGEMTKKDVESALDRSIEAMLDGGQLSSVRMRGISWGSARAGRHGFGRMKMKDEK